MFTWVMESDHISIPFDDFTVIINSGFLGEDLAKALGGGEGVDKVLDAGSANALLGEDGQEGEGDLGVPGVPIGAVVVYISGRLH